MQRHDALVTMTISFREVASVRWAGRLRTLTELDKKSWMQWYARNGGYLQLGTCAAFRLQPALPVAGPLILQTGVCTSPSTIRSFALRDLWASGPRTLVAVFEMAARANSAPASHATLYMAGARFYLNSTRAGGNDAVAHFRTGPALPGCPGEDTAAPAVSATFLSPPYDANSLPSGRQPLLRIEQCAGTSTESTAAPRMQV